MDYEESANLSNITFDHDVTPAQSKHLITQEIIFTIFVMIGITADTTIIFTILRFKRLRTVPNLYLANWALADMCSLIHTPSTYRIISVIDEVSLSAQLMCALFQIDLIFHHTAVIFMIVIAFDWCMAAYFPRLSRKFRNFHKYLIIALWVLALLISGILIWMCLKHVYFRISACLFLFDYCTIFLLVVVLHTSRTIRVCKKNPLSYPSLMLTLVTVYTLCWLTSFLNFFFIELHALHPVLGVVSECFIFSSAIINLILLYCLNKDFQACFIQIFKHLDRRYTDTLPEFESLDQSVSDRCTVPMILENSRQNCDMIINGQLHI